MGKYDILESSNRLLANYSTIIKPPDVVPKPLNVIVKTTPTLDVVTSYNLEITWDKPTITGSIFITSYLVEFSRNGDIYGSRQEILEDNSRVARYENVGSGQFQARVAAVTAINNKISAWEISINPGYFFPINFNLDFTDPDTYGSDP